MKIAVLCLPGIGDALMATPMVEILHKAMPDASIDLICMFDGVEYIYKQNKAINKVYNLPLYQQNRLIGLLKIASIRKNKYDISILAYPAYRSEYNIIHFLLGAKKRIAHKYNKGYFREFHFLNTNLISLNLKEHIVINNLNLLKALNISWELFIKNSEISYIFSLTRDDITFGKRYFRQLLWDLKSVIAIHPGSVDSKVGLLKRWPEANIIELIKKFIHKKKKILLFAGPFEKELVDRIAKSVDDYSNCLVVKNVSFGQALGILQNISILICNDNGFAHLANGLGVKEIVLFGPTNPLWCAPYDKSKCRVLRKASFSPWFRNDMKVTEISNNALSGMESITVDDVFKEIDKI